MLYLVIFVLQSNSHGVSGGAEQQKPIDLVQPDDVTGDYHFLLSTVQ